MFFWKESCLRIRERQIYTAFTGFFICLLLLIGSPAYGETIDHSDWNQFLKKYAASGRVSYAAIQEDRNLLQTYLDYLTRLTPDFLGTLNRESRIAFWINLYNAVVISQILNHPGIKSVEEIPDFFKAPVVHAAQVDLSLNDLKNEVLRKGFRDERILFALVSGRMDSPKLLAEAYMGERLEEQLDFGVRQFVDDETFNQIQVGARIAILSQIFADDGEDFLLRYGSLEGPRGFSKTEAAVISFILNYERDAEKRLYLYDGKYKIQYHVRDSRLNQNHPQSPQNH